VRSDSPRQNRQNLTDEKGLKQPGELRALTVDPAAFASEVTAQAVPKDLPTGREDGLVGKDYQEAAEQLHRPAGGDRDGAEQGVSPATRHAAQRESEGVRRQGLPISEDSATCSMAVPSRVASRRPQRLP